jgi:chemotaxis protein MotB
MRMLRKKIKGALINDVDNGQSEVQTVYADLVTFIMMLFILLFVLSYNDQSTHDFMTELQIKFGEDIKEKQQTLTTDALLVSKINHYIKKEDLSQYAHVVVDEYRVKLILNHPVLFDSGKIAIKSKGKKILADVGKIFDSVINPLEIEGHTDNVPINTEDFASNWELSFFRAYEVVKYYIYDRGFSPIRLTAKGFGEYRPIRPNDTAKDRAMNRRIEINVIRISESEQFSN